MEELEDDSTSTYLKKEGSAGQTWSFKATPYVADDDCMTFCTTPPTENMNNSALPTHSNLTRTVSCQSSQGETASLGMCSVQAIAADGIQTLVCESLAGRFNVIRFYQAGVDAERRLWLFSGRVRHARSELPPSRRGRPARLRLLFAGCGADQSLGRDESRSVPDDRDRVQLRGPPRRGCPGWSLGARAF